MYRTVPFYAILKQPSESTPPNIGSTQRKAWQSPRMRFLGSDQSAGEVYAADLPIV
jgi:hypothetical protein